MSYVSKRIGRRRKGLAGLGDLASIINSVSSVVGTSVDVASDPYLQETLCHIGQLKQINAGQSVGTCTDTADDLAGGVGLRSVVKPLRAYVWAQQNKWIYPVIAAGILGIPFLIGYDVGKGGRK